MTRRDNNGRDAKGRFAKGNAGGPGRPKRDVEREYLAQMTANCTLSQFAKIVNKAAEQAIAGDHRARQWLSQYLLPDPQTMREMTEADHPATFSADSPIQEALRLIRLRHDAGKKFHHYDTGK